MGGGVLGAGLNSWDTMTPSTCRCYIKHVLTHLPNGNISDIWIDRSGTRWASSNNKPITDNDLVDLGTLTPI